MKTKKPFVKLAFIMVIFLIRKYFPEGISDNGTYFSWSWTKDLEETIKYENQT